MRGMLLPFHAPLIVEPLYFEPRLALAGFFFQIRSKSCSRVSMSDLASHKRSFEARTCQVHVSLAAFNRHRAATNALCQAPAPVVVGGSGRSRDLFRVSN